MKEANIETLIRETTTLIPVTNASLPVNTGTLLRETNASLPVTNASLPVNPGSLLRETNASLPVMSGSLLRETNASLPVSIGTLLGVDPQEEDAAYRDHGLCVVGVFGKSSMQAGGPLKESAVNNLSDKHIFPLFGGTDPGTPGSPGPPGSPGTPGSPDSHIQALYHQESRVLYLLLSSVSDSLQLLRACEALSAGAGHSDSHDFWKGLDRQQCLHLLYLFSVCHVLLLVHPNHTFDVTYDRLFRALDALRQKTLPVLRAALKDSPVSKEWRTNCRPCPPRLLFVFSMNGALKVSTNGSDSVNPDKPKKHSPRRRLQHALEDQIYRIFRKSRVLTNQSSNCLFTVPANQAFVYVTAPADHDPLGALIAQLRSNCVLSEPDPAAVPVQGPRRYQQMRRSARPPGGGVGDPAGVLLGGQLVDCSLREFLWQHVELVLTKKGFDDSVGRNPQPSHFELPSLAKWLQVAARLHQVLIAGSAHQGLNAGSAHQGLNAGSAHQGLNAGSAHQGLNAGSAHQGLNAGSAHQGLNAGSAHDETAELAAKVQGQLKVLEGFLDADAKFSENRCQKALPLAHSAYQSNLPHNYTTTVHKNQLAAALRVYSQHGRGVAFQRYARQLHDDCYKFWSNGHQLCEERSLTDQHCVHKFHLLPQPGEKPDVDRNPPILNHNSRGRSTGSCNCGRKQAPREDPFDVQAANYDFYQMLEEKCCAKLERIDFPVFQPSTPDPAPAQRPPGEAPGSGGEAPGSGGSGGEAPGSGVEAAGSGVEAPGSAGSERLKEPSSTAQSHTPADTSLSLALSLGQSTDSLDPPYGDEDAPDTQKSCKRPSLVDRQPSTVEFLPGMLHSGCPSGLLPKFSSWSLVRLGPAKTYSCHVGLEQPGFLPGSSFLLPWDLVIRSRSEDESGPAEALDSATSSSWPAPNKSLVGKRGSAGGPGRGRRRDDTARVYVGFEYEDARGRRFISCGPDKIVKVLGPGGAKEPASRVLNTDMPLFVPSPSQGRGLKPHYAQLSRLFVVVPDAALEVTLNPQVQPGPPPCPVFHPEQVDVVLPPDGVWVLRFPFSYCTERGPCYPPKENQPISSYRVLRGILKASAAAPPTH